MRKISVLMIIIMLITITLLPQKASSNVAFKIIAKQVTKQTKEVGQSMITKAGVRTSNKTALERANDAWFARLAREEAEAIALAGQRATPSGTPGWLKIAVGATLWATGVDIIMDLLSEPVEDREPIDYYSTENYLRNSEAKVTGDFGIKHQVVQSPKNPNNWTLLFTDAKGDQYYFSTFNPINQYNDITHIKDYDQSKILKSVKYGILNDETIYIDLDIEGDTSKDVLINPTKYGFNVNDIDYLLSHTPTGREKIWVFMIDIDNYGTYYHFLRKNPSSNNINLPVYRIYESKNLDETLSNVSIDKISGGAWFFGENDPCSCGPWSTAGRIYTLPWGVPDGTYSFTSYSQIVRPLDMFLTQNINRGYFKRDQTTNMLYVQSTLPDATYMPQPTPAYIPNPNTDIFPDDEYAVEILIPDPSFYPDTVLGIQQNANFLQGLEPYPNLNPIAPPEPAPGNNMPINIEDPGTPGLNIITTKFPFSLPWDIYHLISLLVADPVPPAFLVDTVYRDLDIEFSHEMSYLDPYMPFFRTFIFIVVAGSIIYRTRSLLGGAN